MHADADAKERAARRNRFERDLVQTGVSERFAAPTEGPDAGQDDRGGAFDLGRVRGEDRVRTDVFQRLLCGAQVADAVVEHRDARRRTVGAAVGSDHRVPLVEGSVVPSMRTASRSARAAAFTDASMM